MALTLTSMVNPVLEWLLGCFARRRPVALGAQVPKGDGVIASLVSPLRKGRLLSCVQKGPMCSLFSTRLD
jgi:hypothetical protein